MKQLCIDLEHYETPEWVARAILAKEILTQRVVDPCAGAGVLAEAARAAGYDCRASDIHDWGLPYPGAVEVFDFLYTDPLMDERIRDNTVFMNPPFSLAEKFIEQCAFYGARKILCFQRFAWWESAGRGEFWQKYPPSRIYICGSRADCWRHDLPKDAKGNRFDPVTGKKLAGSPTAHAWFVFEPAHPSGTVLGHIYKGNVA